MRCRALRGRRARAALGVFAAGLGAGLARASEIPSPASRELAERAASDYETDAVALLAELIAFRTVHVSGTPNAENPEFQRLTRYLARRCGEWGFDFEDRGAAVVVGLGSGAARLGIITHADVQPADPDQWRGDPYRLDRESEPGRLVGRGAEDDKGPLALALTAMRVLKEHGPGPRGRVELFVAYTEESDWEPLQAVLENYDPPPLNVALDANYPVVTAEKGWGDIHLRFPGTGEPEAGDGPFLRSFAGGAFLSQVPEHARAVIARAGPDLESALRRRATSLPQVAFDFQREGDDLVVTATGRAAHSMNPWDGRNAIAFLAELLGGHPWPPTPAARLVDLAVELVGTGDYAERFGDLAYSHPFMGRLTLTLATVEEEDAALVAGISFRRPVGRGRAEVEDSIRRAVDAWKREAGAPDVGLEMRVLDPYLLEDAPHVETLLAVFRHFTGRADSEPIAIGGGTNARLFPNGVSFGPAMPDVEYTGHSEHEFMSEAQFLLNLRMYTAMLAELSAADAAR